MPAKAAEKRFALVIGNSDYVNAPKLPNAANDARDLAAKLQSLGFDVTLGTDVDFRGFNAKVLEFRDKLRDQHAQSAVFYYAGHGFTLRGRNRLVPVDAALDSKDNAAESTLVLDRVMDFIQLADDQQTVILLDACRNNPLPKKQQDEGSEQGLARLANDAPNIAVVFATKPGKVTQDGLGRNSPFTTALLTVLDKPGLDYGAVVQNVYNEVSELTNNQQRPDQQGILPKPFIFNQENVALNQPPAAPAPEAPAQPEGGETLAVPEPAPGNSGEPVTPEAPEVTQPAAPDGGTQAQGSDAPEVQPGAGGKPADSGDPGVVAQSGGGTEVPADGASSPELSGGNSGATTLNGVTMLDGETPIASNQPPLEQDSTATRNIKPMDEAGTAPSAASPAPVLPGEEIGGETSEAPAAPSPPPGADAQPQTGQQPPPEETLPQKQASLGTAPSNLEPPGVTVKAIEAELKRVGCFADSPDESWDQTSQQALESYFKQKGKAAPTELSDSLLSSLESETGQNVCVAANSKQSKPGKASQRNGSRPVKPSKPSRPNPPRQVKPPPPKSPPKASQPQSKPSKKRLPVFMGN